MIRLQIGCKSNDVAYEHIKKRAHDREDWCHWRPVPDYLEEEVGPIRLHWKASRQDGYPPAVTIGRPVLFFWARLMWVCPSFSLSPGLWIRLPKQSAIL